MNMFTTAALIIVALVSQHALLVKAAAAGITGGPSGAETGQTSTGCPHSASLQLPTRHLVGSSSSSSCQGLDYTIIH